MDAAAADIVARKAWLGLLARAPADRLLALCAGVEAPAFDRLRPAETGAVMVRGRAGGTGAPFNLGEMTVTRASVRLADGRIGHACVQGRSRAAAEAAALLDALMQGPEAERVEGAVLAPLRAEADRRARARAGKAERTRVDFFTLVRGED